MFRVLGLFRVPFFRQFDPGSDLGAGRFLSSILQSVSPGFGSRRGLVRDDGLGGSSYLTAKWPSG